MSLPPDLFTHLLLFWPAVIIATIGPLLILSIYLYVIIPSIRPIIILLWILSFLSIFTTVSYSGPNSWFARSIYKSLMPSSLKELGWKIKDRSGFDHSRQAIYIWYPHSHFAITPFALIAGGLGDSTWKRSTMLCVAPPFFDLPAIRHISLGFGLVRSDYDSMKGSLKQGTSIVILPGGAKEVGLASGNKIRLVDGRKGFLRLAKELNLPLIPIIAHGENAFFERDSVESSGSLHKVMKSMGGGLQAPSWSSMKAWFNRPVDPVTMKIGRPFIIEPDWSIEVSMKKWKNHVNAFDSSIEWVSGEVNTKR